MIVIKSIDISQCVLNQCKVSFDNITKFLMNPEFELLQDKDDVPSTMDILRNLFEPKEGVV